jgi:ankyrin repeat protein
LLILAACEGAKECVQEILQAISDERLGEIIQNKYGYQSKNLPFIVLLRSYIENTLPYEETALICASEKGYVDIIKQLLVCGTNINAKFKSNHASTLIFAAQNGHAAAVRLLIQNNANITTQTSSGLTALMVAIIHKASLPTIKMLIHPEIASIDEIDEVSKQFCKPAEVLELASQEWESCPLDVLHFCVQPFIPFIDNGINLQDNRGMTALMWTAHYSNYEAVEYLLTNDADTSITDKSGKTAVGYTDDPRIKSLLKIRKADQIS